MFQSEKTTRLQLGGLFVSAISATFLNPDAPDEFVDPL
jgi:hypothetical protein